MAERKENKLVTVYQAGQMVEAEIIKNMLVSNGIWAVIKKTAVPNEWAVGAQMIYNIPIQVLEHDVLKASKLIKQGEAAK